ncbi:hypothetical protein CsSME_00014906 [Camellia sinensis var. sinensis]
MPSFAFRTSFTTTTKKVSLPTPISQLCKARLSREEVIFQGGSRAGEGREKCTTYYPFLCDMVWLKNLKWCCIYSLLIILSWEIDVHILKAPWRGRICLKDTVLNIGLDQKICSRNYLVSLWLCLSLSILFIGRKLILCWSGGCQHCISSVQIQIKMQSESKDSSQHR